MNAASRLQWVPRRWWGSFLLTFLFAGLLLWAGCVDWTTTGGGSYRALLTLRAVVSEETVFAASEIDGWRVEVIRPGEGVIGEAGGSVGLGQETVQVPPIEVTLKTECEGLRIRIELASGGTVWWAAEREYQVCAVANNGIEVPETAFQWVGPVRPVVSPTALQFQVGQGGEASQGFVITYGGSGNLSWSARVEGQNTGWLSVEPSSGTVSGGSTQEVTVRVNGTGLAVGSYTAVVVVEGDGVPPERVGVAMTVVEGPRIGLAPSGLSFEADQGTNPGAQTFTVTHVGQSGTLNWGGSSNQGWLTMSPRSGTLGVGASQTVTVTVGSGGLGDGVYGGAITVAAVGAVNTPQSLPVTLTVREVYGSSISGRVTAGEGGLAGVTATLSGPGGTMQGTTGPGGDYGFTGLADGSYTVSISGYPAGVEFGQTTQAVSVGVNESRTVDFVGVWRYTLTVMKTGQGVVTSSPGGITCGADCTESYPGGTAVTLTAAPLSGWRVGSWGGACGGVPAGSAQCTVVMDGNRTASVTFEEIPPTPVLVRSPASMTFHAVEGGANPATQTLQISNGGGGTLSWSVSDNAAWLSISPASGTSTGETDGVTVDVNLGELEAGTYNATITVTGAAPATGSPQTTAVTLIVDPPAPVLVRSPASMTFNGVVGGPNPTSQTLLVSNGGGGTLSWSVSDNAAWLTLTPTSGTSTGEADNVTVSVNTGGLTAGTYNATITVAGVAPATGSPQTTAVTLVVAPGPALVRSPSSMTFNAVQGGSNPASQTLQISNGGGGTLSWSVSDNAAWLTLTPTSGTSTGEADNVTVSVNTGGLTAGNYNATITVTGAAPATGSPQTTTVTLAMGPPTTSGPMLFTSGSTGNNEIWVRSASGTQLTQLTTTGSGTSNWDAEWSPNGTRIIFSSYRNGLNDHVWIMNADGSSQTALTTNPVQNVYPSWSPDGSKIVFASGSGTGRNLWTMNNDGTNLVQLTSSGAEDSQADWSPNGSQIVFFSARSGTWQIWVMNANGSNQTQLTFSTFGASNDFFPAWSPDGSKIAFVSDRNGNYEIYVMNADGSNQTRLTNTSATDLHPSWSPDGTKIVFSSDRDGQQEIYIMDANGSNQTRLTTISGGNQFPNIRN